jgi:predicted nucleic acid-binding protein
MIFIDSNIPMYLIGKAHPNKSAAQKLLEQCLSERVKLVSDAEVMQEILHRYVSIHRRDAIQPAFEALLSVVDEVFGVDLPEIQRAKEIVLGSREVSARDALHVAVMERRHVERILTFDVAFDRVPGIARIR